MAATEPTTPTRDELLQEIRGLWDKMKAPGAATPEGPWFRQLESYTQIMLGATKRRLRRLANSRPKDTVLLEEIKGIREELEVLQRCIDILLRFAEEKD